MTLADFSDKNVPMPGVKSARVLLFDPMGELRPLLETSLAATQIQLVIARRADEALSIAGADGAVVALMSSESMAMLETWPSPVPIVTVDTAAGSLSKPGAFAQRLLHVDPAFVASPHFAQWLLMLLERQALICDNRELGQDFENLNSGLQQMVDDKVREIAALKDQLSAMFVAVPDVLAAGTIEAKLERAAAALTAPNFFRECLILYQDPDSGWRIVAQGIESFPENPEVAYRDFAARIGDQRSSVVVLADGDTGKTFLVPLKDGEGRMRGICRLAAPDTEFPAQRESLALVELFLDEVVQSVEHFRLERHLEQSEASYRLLIDNVSDVIFRLDAEARFAFVSRRVQEILGLTWKQLLGRHFWEFLPEDDVSMARQHFEELLAGRSLTRDVRLLRPDGREIIVYVSADPIIERGGVTGALGIARDVTEKRELERQIAESERKYRRLTENAYDAIFLVDADTLQIVDVNPRAEKLTGYSRDELLNMLMFQLRSGDQEQTLRQRIEEVMSAGTGRYEDTPLIRKDGSPIAVETAASSVELEGKRYYHSIVRDMSEHQRMTSELNQRVMELQILAEVSDALQSTIDLNGVMRIVLAGVTAGNGLGFNRAFILTYDKARQELQGEAGVGPGSAEEAGRIWQELAERGWSLPDILRRKSQAVVAEDDTAGHMAHQLVIPLDHEHELFLKVIQAREARVVSPSQELDELPPSFYEQYQAREFAVVPLATRDDVIGVLLVDNLVTGAPIEEGNLNRLKLFANAAASAIERSRLLQSLEKRLHELTRANRELKESRDRLVKTERLSAIGEVAASVAHEIRNPLAAIGGFARSVFQTLPEDDRNKSKVKVIVEETDRLELILSGLLEFSRPAVPRFTDVDINSLVLQTIHFMDAEIDEDLIRVTYDLDPELPRVWADGQQMRQVLLNVLRNAVQAMPGGGTLTIVSRADDKEVWVSIQDSGPGIPADEVNRIFDAFYTTKPTGSGLGLAISAQIVRNHNGRIIIQPTGGKGAKFLICLPIAPKSA